MKLILAFLAVPLVEIYLFISLGGAIGAGWTIALVALTAVVGGALVSAQGFATLARAQAALAAGRPPAMEIMEGFVLFAAGAVLLTPGFFTDAVGFALLLPGLRRGLIRRVVRAGAFSAGARRWPGAGARDAGDARGRRGRIIDAEYEKSD